MGRRSSGAQAMAETVVWGTDDGETLIWGTACTDPSCTQNIWSRR